MKNAIEQSIKENRKMNIALAETEAEMVQVGMDGLLDADEVKNALKVVRKLQSMNEETYDKLCREYHEETGSWWMD